MKKNIIISLLVLVSLFTLVGCGSSSNSNKNSRTVEELLDLYVKAYTTADIDAVSDLFPPFYIEYAKESLTKKHLEESLKIAKEVYGDDFTILYEITNKTKVTEEELESINEEMKNLYSAEEKATECYKIEGSITFKGTNEEDEDPLTTLDYCKYDDGWYLINVYG